MIESSLIYGGYFTKNPFRLDSKTSILYALIKPASTTKIQTLKLGSIKPSAIKYFNSLGVETPVTIYLGSTKVWEQ